MAELEKNPESKAGGLPVAVQGSAHHDAGQLELQHGRPSPNDPGLDFAEVAPQRRSVGDTVPPLDGSASLDEGHEAGWSRQDLVVDQATVRANDAACTASVDFEDLVTKLNVDFPYRDPESMELHNETLVQAEKFQTRPSSGGDDFLHQTSSDKIDSTKEIEENNVHRVSSRRDSLSYEEDSFSRSETFEDGDVTFRPYQRPKGQQSATCPTPDSPASTNEAGSARPAETQSVLREQSQSRSKSKSRPKSRIQRKFAKILALSTLSVGLSRSRRNSVHDHASNTTDASDEEKGQDSAACDHDDHDDDGLQVVPNGDQHTSEGDSPRAASGSHLANKFQKAARQVATVTKMTKTSQSRNPFKALQGAVKKINTIGLGFPPSPHTKAQT